MMGDCLRMRVLMKYEVGVALQEQSTYQGEALVQWEPVREHPRLKGHRAEIALAALHYGEALGYDKDARAELFHRVGEAATRLLSPSWPGHSGPEESLQSLFEEYTLIKNGKRLRIWPWLISSPGAVSLVKPKQMHVDP